MQIIPQEKWILFAHQIILHGRALCVARKPRCGECALNPLCYAKDKTADNFPKANGQAPAKPVSLDGVEEALFEDLAFGAVPIVGDVTSILMDYDFIRRVDTTARRVFQERWLKDHGKLDEIHPAPVSQRRSSLEGGIDLVAQLVYLGSFGVGFGVAFPLTLVARGARGFDNSLVRGVKQGAGDAARDADRFLFRFRSATASAKSAAAESPPELSVSAAS